jgi:dienelactone hydrolase
VAVDEQPPHLRPFLLDPPARQAQRRGRIDLYPPDADGPRPAVVFVHGGPVPPGVQPGPRDWLAYRGFGRYAASLGVVGVTVEHRLHALTDADFARAAGDLAEAVAAAREDPRVDAQRVALWHFSGGGLLAAPYLAAPPPWLRCVALSYPLLAPLPGQGPADARFYPAAAVRAAGRLPIVLTRVELESAPIAATVAQFLDAARRCGAEIEVIDVPGGHHGFEIVDHTQPAREAVAAAARSILRHLGAADGAPQDRGGAAN